MLGTLRSYPDALFDTRPGVTLASARQHAANAAAALAELPANAYRDALIELTEFVVERAY